MSFKRFLYSLFLYTIFPLVLMRLLWRSRLNPDYRKRWSERLGLALNHAGTIRKPTDIKDNLQSNAHAMSKPIIWLHAVSVGEAIAAKPLVQELFDTFPTHCILMTTTTPTGSDRVQSMFADEIQNQQLIHTYFPYDLLGSVSRFLRGFKPQILIVVETEIWPNLYAECHKQNVPVMMVNARLSDKSTHSYLKIRSLVSETLSKVGLIAVRSKSDAERFISLGAKPEQIEEIGNIKFDINIDQAQLAKTQQYSKVIYDGDIDFDVDCNGKDNSEAYKNKRPVFVAASTHDGEDSKVLFIYKSLIKQFPRLLLVLVPRHPERFDQVYNDCLDKLPEEFRVIRRSAHHYNSSETNESNSETNQQINVILGDSMGEMQMWYALADVVFIGGSLVKTGGHNPLEATLYGVPVVSGPHMFNFEDIALELSEADLLSICKDEFELKDKLSEFLVIKNSEDLANPLFKDTAQDFMQQHRGVTKRLINKISKALNV